MLALLALQAGLAVRARPPHATSRPRRASSCSGLGRWLKLLKQIAPG